MNKTEILERAATVADKLLDTPLNAAGRQVASEAYEVIHELMGMLRRTGQISAADIARAYLEATGEILTSEQLCQLCKLNDPKMVTAAMRAAISSGEIQRMKHRPAGAAKSVWHYVHAKHVHRYATDGITTNLNDSLKAAHAHFFAATGTTQ